MRVQVYIKVVLLLLAIQLALPGQSVAKSGEVINQSNFGFKAGYRIDKLDWSIGEPAMVGIPNILSELTYENIKIAQIQIDGSIDVGNGHNADVTVHLRGMAGAGLIISGESQDSDYAGDDRTLEFSRSTSTVDSDYTLDLDLAIGPKFHLGKNTFYILPLLGYSYHRIEMIDTNGVQTVSDQANYDLLVPPFAPSVMPPLGPFSGLRSSYDTTMDSFYAGLEFGITPNDKFNIIFGGKYHFFDYEGVADWNLRSDLAHPISFIHKASGIGYSAHLDVIVGIGEAWTLNFGGLYRDWSTDPGTEIWFDNTGTAFWQNFNGANWVSYSGNVGLSYHFR